MYTGYSREIPNRTDTHDAKISDKSKREMKYSVLRSFNKKDVHFRKLLLFPTDPSPPTFFMLCVESICMILLGTLSDYGRWDMPIEFVRAKTVCAYLGLHRPKGLFSLNMHLSLNEAVADLGRPKPDQCEICGSENELNARVRLQAWACLSCYFRDFKRSLPPDHPRRGPCSWCGYRHSDDDGHEPNLFYLGQVYCDTCRDFHSQNGHFNPRRSLVEIDCSCVGCDKILFGPNINVKPGERRSINKSWYCRLCFEAIQAKKEHSHDTGMCKCNGCPVRINSRTKAPFRLKLSASGKMVCLWCLKWELEHPGMPHTNHPLTCVRPGCTNKPALFHLDGRICNKCYYREIGYLARAESGRKRWRKA